MITHIAVAIETGSKKSFASAVDWPGWARGGKSLPAALEALEAYAPRYALVAMLAGAPLPPEGIELEVLESNEGGSGTDFGVPSRVRDADRRPTTATDADRLARLVEAAWARLAEIAASAPEELRKGPRGGGRNRTKMLDHVADADWSYAKEIGVRVPQPAAGDARAITALREAMLEVLRRPSDGSPLADRRWTARYAAHRIAWHALDHAWEMEDRSEPG